MHPLLYDALGKAIIKRTGDGGLNVPEAGIWRLVATFALIGGLAIAAETGLSRPDTPDTVMTARISAEQGAAP